MALGVWNRVQGLVFGGAIGAAFSRALEPILEPVRQHAWERNSVRVLGVDHLAELVARGFVDEAQLVDEAKRTGWSVDRLAALAALAQTYPGLGELDRMSNRNLIGPTLLEKALSRHGIPGEWHPAIVELFNDLLSPSQVAEAVQQGHLPNPGILPDLGTGTTPARGAAPPATPDDQPPTSVPLTTIDLDPITEAAGGGIDEPRLKVLANLAGLPPGSELLLQMWNRGLIDEGAVDAGIREGHLKTKWTAAFKRLRWAVLSAPEFANLYLRGWIEQDAMYAGGALTGHTKDQMDLMYLNRGRPLAPVQAAVAWARKSPHPQGQGYTDRPGTFDEEDFLRAIKQSDVRTEYGPILWHNRFAYPTLFQLGRLAQAGALPRERVETILGYERYEPEDVQALLDFWYSGSSSGGKKLTVAQLQARAIAGRLTRSELVAQLRALGYSGTGAAALAELADDQLVASSRTTAVSDLHTAYKKGDVSDDQAAAALLELGLADWAPAAIVANWRIARDAAPAPLPPHDLPL